MNKYLEKVADLQKEALRAYDRVRMLKMFGADRIEGESHKAFLRQARKQNPKAYEQAYHSDSSTHSPELKRQLAAAREGAWKKTQGESYLEPNQAKKVPSLNREAKGGTVEWGSGVSSGKIEKPIFGTKGGVSFKLDSPKSGSIHLHPGDNKYLRLNTIKNVGKRELTNAFGERVDTSAIVRGNEVAVHPDKVSRGSGFLNYSKGSRQQVGDRFYSELFSRNRNKGQRNLYNREVDYEQAGNFQDTLYSKYGRKLPSKRTNTLADRASETRQKVNKELDTYNEDWAHQEMTKNTKVHSLRHPKDDTPRLPIQENEFTSTKSTQQGDYMAFPMQRGIKNSGHLRGTTTKDLIVNGRTGKVTTNTLRGLGNSTPIPSYMTRDYTPGKHRNRNFQTTEPTAPAKSRGSFHNLSLAEKRQVADQVRGQMGKPHPEL